MFEAIKSKNYCLILCQSANDSKYIEVIVVSLPSLAFSPSPTHERKWHIWRKTNARESVRKRKSDVKLLHTFIAPPTMLSVYSHACVGLCWLPRNNSTETWNEAKMLAGAIADDTRRSSGILARTTKKTKKTYEIEIG